MKELSEIAKSHYWAGSGEVQALAYQFFQSMDTNGDRRVDISEFLAFMRQEGYTNICNPNFFNELDHDGNGTLDFYEVMTLYYIIKTGRPFCGCCANFIPGIFFSCVECFKNPKTPFDLCCDCYRSSNSDHNHGGRVQFLDNYTLLQAKRDSGPAQTSAVNPTNQGWTTSSNAIVHTTYPTTHVLHPPNSSNPIFHTTYPTTHVLHPPLLQMQLSQHQIIGA